jgi:alanine racemase
MVRPGILFYGASPSTSLPLSLPVKQALRWVTSVVFFKVVQAGFPVSYGSSWSPGEQTRVITLPVGYGDGYVRSMTGRAEVLLHGRRVKVVGRICMDQVMVDIGWTSAFNGDEVVLLGNSVEAGGSGREPDTDDSGRAIRIEELATWAGTIPHEVLTSINTRVPRIYKG